VDGGGGGGSVVTFGAPVEGNRSPKAAVAGARRGAEASRGRWSSGGGRREREREMCEGRRHRKRIREEKNHIC
jgi:hypothetical protein